LTGPRDHLRYFYNEKIMCAVGAAGLAETGHLSRRAVSGAFSHATFSAKLWPKGMACTELTVVHRRGAWTAATAATFGRGQRETG